MAVVPGTGATVTLVATELKLGVLSIAFGGMSRPAIDTTVMGTTNERAYIPGLMVDPGELVVELLMDSLIGATNTQPEFLAIASGAVKITMPDGVHTIEGSGIVTGLDMGIPVEDRMVATMTIKLHGATTFNTNV